MNIIMNIPIYKNIKPTVFEHVLVKFIEHTETHIKAVLIDYKFEGIMLHDDATRKKRVYNWRKTVPLNKVMVARVEEILTFDCVKLSIAYFDNKKDPEELSKELLKPFQENNVLITLIKKLSNTCNIEFNSFWTNIIYEIDTIRRENDITESLLEVFKNNTSIVNELITLKYPDNYNELIDTLNKLINSKNYKIQTKFSIISNLGINNTKQLLKLVEDETNGWEYTLKYLNTPFYILESFSENSNENNHTQFIELLTQKSSEFDIKLVIESVGNIIN